MKGRAFSIILPTRNRPVAFRRALTSALRQSYDNFELIIVDDGSSQDYAFQAQAAANDPRIILIEHPENLGVAAARNRGIDRATGRFVSFLDDDDEFDEHLLQETCSMLSRTPDHVAACWSIPKLVSDGASLAARSQHAQTEDELMGCFLSSGAGCALTLKRACLKSIGGFNEAFTFGEDTELFVRFLAYGYRPIMLPSHLINVHRDANECLSATATHQERSDICQWIRLAYADFLSDYPGLRGMLDPFRVSNPFGYLLD